MFPKNVKMNKLDFSKHLILFYQNLREPSYAVKNLKTFLSSIDPLISAVAA